MKIKNVDPKAINWRRGRHSKYSPIYAKLRKMKIGSAIEVTLEENRPQMGISVYQNFRKKRADFLIRCSRQDKNGKVWIFYKVKRTV